MPPKSATIDALLADRELPVGTERASVHPCEGAKFHSPSPLLTILHRVGARQWWLCANCESNLDVFLELSGKSDLPWEVQREFGNGIRSIGNEVRQAQENADG